MNIDWVSFTLEGKSGLVLNSVDLWWVAKGLLHQHFGDAGWLFIESDMPFTPCVNRAPYKFASRRLDNGVTFYGHPDREEVLVEMSGRSFPPDWSIETMGDFLRPIADCITRLDLCVDWQTDVTPHEFVSAGYANRFRSNTSINSATGQTEYVGSPKSDVMARVYRYAAPHPRSALLRFEAVFRRQRAKDAAAWLANAPDAEIAQFELFEVFGWQHELAESGYGYVPSIPFTKASRNENRTVHWLYSQVTSSIVKQLHAGNLDWDHFYDHLVDELEKLQATDQS